MESESIQAGHFLHESPLPDGLDLLYSALKTMVALVTGPLFEGFGETGNSGAIPGRPRRCDRAF